MNISVKKIRTNIDYANLKTNTEDPTISKNQNENNDLVELPQINEDKDNSDKNDEPDYYTADTKNESSNYPERETNFQGLEKEEEDECSTFFGRPNSYKRVEKKYKNYGNVIYIGLGLALLGRILA